MNTFLSGEDAVAYSDEVVIGLTDAACTVGRATKRSMKTDDNSRKTMEKNPNFLGIDFRITSNVALSLRNSFSHYYFRAERARLDSLVMPSGAAVANLENSTANDVRTIADAKPRALRVVRLVVSNQLSSQDTVNWIVTSRESPADMVAGDEARVHAGY